MHKIILVPIVKYIIVVMCSKVQGVVICWSASPLDLHFMTIGHHMISCTSMLISLDKICLNHKIMQQQIVHYKCDLCSLHCNLGIWSCRTTILLRGCSGHALGTMIVRVSQKNGLHKQGVWLLIKSFYIMGFKFNLDSLVFNCCLFIIVLFL